MEGLSANDQQASCSDLEHLATAATSMIGSHVIEMDTDSDICNFQQANFVVSSLPGSIFTHIPMDTCDISRPQQYITLHFPDNQQGRVSLESPIILENTHLHSLNAGDQHVLTSYMQPSEDFLCQKGNSNTFVLARNHNQFLDHPVAYKVYDEPGCSVDQFASCRNPQSASGSLSPCHLERSIELNPAEPHNQPSIQYITHNNNLMSTNENAFEQSPILYQTLSKINDKSKKANVDDNEGISASVVMCKASSSQSKTKRGSSSKSKVSKSTSPSIKNISEAQNDETKSLFTCSQCNEKFLKAYLYKRHLVTHTGEKRGSLSLEKKVEIIKRLQNGEKQIDLAVEYNVGRSTLSFLVTNAEKFFTVLKNGKFNPETKKLRGAECEDIETALHEWYKQACSLGQHVSGPILCQKAKDFALKLGYQNFKATHGWLDRFKKRKDVTLIRRKSQKDKVADGKKDDLSENCSEEVFPNFLADYQTNNVFFASEIGLLHRIFPYQVNQYKGARCSGGTNSKRRITVLMCANMTGSEKFPLLVIGKPKRPKCFQHVKSLPVQYVSNERSWMTKESFMDWLNNLNSWFTQQNRKIVLLLSNIPIHPKNIKLSYVKVLICPSNFADPSSLGISSAFKRTYRRFLLEHFFAQAKKFSTTGRRKAIKSCSKVSFLTCLHMLAASWHSVTDVIINNSFQRSGLGRSHIWNVNNLATETVFTSENLNLFRELRSYGLKIPNSFSFDDFVAFDNDLQICHYMDDDDIIASMTKPESESSESDEDSKEQSTEVPANNLSKSSSSLCDQSTDSCTNQTSFLDPNFVDVESSIEVLTRYIKHNLDSNPEASNVLSQLQCLLLQTQKTYTGFEITNSTT